MKAFLDRLHNKLGDFWWYSLMLFVACRSTDVLNMFVGLWLVPKYIGPQELGAVMPLTSFANMLALPVSVFATTFTKEVNTLASGGEFGKMKSLIRSVFVFAAAFLIIAICITKLTFPLFLERIRVAEGSLAVLIIAASFIGCVSPIYSGVLQALKRFNAFSLLCIISSPVRFLTMLATMPFRALSGYFVGQAASPAASMILSVFFLRKELSVKAEPYWARPVIKRFMRIFLGVGISSAVGMLLGLVEQTILRQRLPALDSAAYYMVTRFSEIATLISGTLVLTLFPYTAETAERGESTRPFVIKAAIPMASFGILLALVFVFLGKPILTLLPNGDQYSTHALAIPWLIGITTVNSLQSFHINTEISACRFAFLKWWVPVHVISTLLLLAITGYGYFTDYIPASWADFLSIHNITSLSAMLWWMTIQALLKFAFCIADLVRQDPIRR